MVTTIHVLRLLLNALERLLAEHDAGWPGPGQCPCTTSVQARAAIEAAKKHLNNLV